MEKKRRIIEIVGSLILLLVLVLMVVGVSYAVWNQTFEGNKTNSITTGYISFNYTEGASNVINITDALPTSDDVGKKLSGGTNQFDFTVSANFSGVNKLHYEVFATPVSSTLDTKYIKVYLTDDKDEPMLGYKDKVPVYSELNNSTTNGSKVLYNGVLDSNKKSQALRLRVWIADDYKMTEEAKKFSFKVSVEASI